MNRIKALFAKVPRLYRLYILAVAQIWMWPQLFSMDMEVNIAMPLFITAIGCFMWNVVRITMAHDDD